MEQTIRKFKLDEESPYKTQGGQLFNQIITKLSQQVDIIFVSFDVDSINSKWMPGVSAPSVLGGLTNEEALEIIKISGLCHKVRLVDFS
jgi:arginase family enzyme